MTTVSSMFTVESAAWGEMTCVPVVSGWSVTVPSAALQPETSDSGSFTPWFPIVW